MSPIDLSVRCRKSPNFLGIICWLVFFGLVFHLQGAPVDRDHALIAATRWQSLTPNPMGKPAGKLGKVETFFNAAGEARFHVVHLEPAGYVVFSADDELEPIIAFSHLDTFVGQAGNPLFDLLHKDTENRMRHLHAKPANQAPALSQPTAKGKWAKLTASSVTCASLR